MLEDWEKLKEAFDDLVSVIIDELKQADTILLLVAIAAFVSGAIYLLFGGEVCN